MGTIAKDDLTKAEYYYPSENEVTLGFECEVNWAGAYDHTFDKHVVRLQDENGTYLNELHDLVEAINDGYAECRVPLLTKDQIKDEGWVQIGGFYWEWPVKNTIYIDGYSSRSLDFRLNFTDAESYLMIEAYERNSFDWERIFAGPCPTINHLRYIMNLFNIKK